MGCAKGDDASAAVGLRDGMRERRRREWCDGAGRSSVFRKEDATP